MHTDLMSAKFETRVIDVEHDDLRPFFLCKLHRRETDRTGADDEHALAVLHLRTLDRVASDPERFHQRELIERQFG